MSPTNLLSALMNKWMDIRRERIGQKHEFKIFETNYRCQNMLLIFTRPSKRSHNLKTCEMATSDGIRWCSTEASSNNQKTLYTFILVIGTLNVRELEKQEIARMLAIDVIEPAQTE